MSRPRTTPRYPTGLSGPKGITIVFSSDVRPMVEAAIQDNNSLVDTNNFAYGTNAWSSTGTGGIEYVAAQFKLTGGYRSIHAATRTLYRCLRESPIMGGSIADALALACETTLYTEDIREYPSRFSGALDIVLTEAEEAGERLSPFDIQERATTLWHETYDRYLIELEPFKDRYELQRLRKREYVARRHHASLA